MKFSVASLALLALAPAAVFARASEPEASVQPLEHFSVEAVFPDSEDLAVAELANDHETPVKFTFTNQELFPVQVATFGGSLTYAGQDKPYTNLTTVKVGSVVVPPQGEHILSTGLKISLPPHDFDLRFNFLVAFEGGVSDFEVDPVKVTVTDPEVSIFDARLIIAQALLALTAIGLGYAAYVLGLSPYLEDRKAAAGPSAAEIEKKKQEQQTSGVVLNENGYDESWIPQHHLNSNKKTKKTTKQN
ncbi:hypothetical protein D0Z00_000835 [Geotrichum galactomycetum]|uniref:Uncharacterized protein n=1 Tax=Geotrichum galactomycetum TaxID=27317 RepID=A0ACB6V8Q9_9ASCO|nr:hypothetical protein D0Z00_000835 [Geotrichum candidum]